MSAVFLDFGSATRGDMDCTKLEQAISPWCFYEESSEQEVLERIKDVEVVVSNKVFLSRAAIFAADRLKLICVSATGYNNIDLAAAAERNIPICNVRAYATPSVVQHVFMLMLNLSCRFVEYQELVRNGGWQASKFFCPLDFGIEELSSKTLGIFGYGELGKGVAEIAKAFGMQVLIAERKNNPARPGRVAFEEVISQADFITLHCPLSQDTQDLISCRELELMKPSAYLINTARGGLVNETDLLHSLTTEQIAGAALDVLHEEPPRNGNLILQHKSANLIVTPHMAWASKQSRQRLLDQLAGNISNFFQGKPFNQVGDSLG